MGWVTPSIWAFSHRDAIGFQNDGSLGAIFLLVAFRRIRETHESEIRAYQQMIMTALAQLPKMIVVLDRTRSFNASALPEVERPAYLRNIEVLQLSVERTEEIIRNVGEWIGDLEARLRRISWAEIALVIVATAQWGFGSNLLKGV